MNYLAAILAVVLTACATHPPAPDTAPASAQNSASESASARDFLLAAAAKDFHDHPAPYPARFRNVRFGHVTTDAQTTQYVLCGEFLPANGGPDPRWTQFVTIKTDPYEQWIGGSSTPWCAGRPLVWEGGDLSASLQRHLDSLR